MYNLIIARKKKKITQKQLAEQIEVHFNMIGRYENGVVLPSVETLNKMADALEVTTDFLLGRE